MRQRTPRTLGIQHLSYILDNDGQSEVHKIAIWVTMDESPLYDLLVSLATPRQVNALSYSEIKQTVKDDISF